MKHITSNTELTDNTLLCSYDLVENRYYQVDIHTNEYCQADKPDDNPYHVHPCDAVVDGVEEPIYTKSAIKI